ncbi:unnamed protein product [Mycena citricolor]|uniref:TAP42-like protein n=1 Tax=Mycena citricolor TaxID=2018698 RepID=A0AAD2HM03_9AGAR|nr:unnamed protein product [Mycena citricolor]
MSITLPALFQRALQNASKAIEQSPFDDTTQDLIRSSLTDLKTLSTRIHGLSMFSPNEILEDISTRDLIYLFVPYVLAETSGRIRTSEPQERIMVLKESQVPTLDGTFLPETQLFIQRYHSLFISDLENFEVVPESERALHVQDPGQVADPTSRRALKIKQYQAEKELKGRIDVIRKRRGQQHSSDTGMESDFALISSLLPQTTTADEDEEDSETEDALRETTLLILRLYYGQAQASLSSLKQESELLKNAPPAPMRPPRPEEDRRGKQRATEDDMWKLNAPSGLGPDGKGPLLDPQGKPLRPFTLLPAGSSDRARFAAQVFGPGHRLPSMSIDEYLQIEQERGNIITGGGPASENAPTSSEQLQMDSELDGTHFGEERAEAKRVKDENWAQFVDANPRGAGNTMNRG